MAPARAEDPWGEIEDLDGMQHYSTLGLDRGASSKEVKKAYRLLAKQLHPDKGGDPAAFARLQHAFEVLSDPRKRQVYDAWARDLQFRYVRRAAAAPGAPVGQGGEDILLDELDSQGLHCDPATQLVVTCEVCRRPATKQCWTCSMAICEFCTLKRHWKDGFPLHWPLVNSDHMRERLGKRELERKRIEDAGRLALEDPNHRSDVELRDIRAFREAAAAVAQLPDAQVRYSPQLAKFWMWAQTGATVFLACRVPTEYEDRELLVECSQRGLLVQSEDSPPLIDRLFEHSVDSARPVETFRTKDNRVLALAIPKAEPGEPWRCLFRGDSDGARCMQPPYSITEAEDDLLLELELPFWTEPADVAVHFGERQLSVDVRSGLHLRRTYWRNREEESRRRDYRVIEAGECLWSLEDDVDAAGERCKLLMLTLARPEPTEEEVTWKKGKRQDHRVAARPGSLHQKGWRFFEDDEDLYGLEDILQALCFLEAGRTFVPAKPWAPLEGSRWETDARLLPPVVQQFVQRFSQQAAEAAAAGETG